MNIKDLGKLELFKELAKLDKDDLLDAVGLETRKSSADYIVPGLLIFGAGLAVGAGLGMLLAPSAGSELRNQLGEAFNKGLEQGKQQYEQVKQKIATQQGSAAGSSGSQA